MNKSTADLAGLSFLNNTFLGAGVLTLGSVAISPTNSTTLLNLLSTSAFESAITLLNYANEFTIL